MLKNENLCVKIFEIEKIRGQVMINEFDFRKYSEESLEDAVSLIKELCAIPAPSGDELRRAEYCRDYLTSIGARGVYIDDAYNCVYPMNADGSNELSVFVAHTDTVFPDTERMPYSDDGVKLRSPGVGDDTASLAVMLLAIKYLLKNGFKPQRGILFVANSCEEGLGNLKGTRKIFADYKGRIAEFVSFDGKIGTIADECVGSHRYEVSVKTPGGHSYSAFGNRNAIDVIAEMVKEIYSIEAPQCGGYKTTYNVGTISGGTSVNTIAENAEMLCEYRSVSAESLRIMKENFRRIFEKERLDANVNIRVVGERPCMEGVDQNKLDILLKKCESAMSDTTGEPVKFSSSSTDCNIPLSLGIPAICTAVYSGGGAHTRSEWVERASLVPGLEIALRTIYNVCS